MPYLKNWAGNVTFSATELARPRETGELRRIVSSASRVHAAGSLHSFSTVADSPGTLVSLDDMPRTVEVDGSARRVRVAAAVRYSELAPVLDKAGLAVPNMASLPHISVAGACATGTHGSGDRNQSLSSSVREIELVTGSGDTVALRRGDDGFDGAVVGLGALGVVTSLTLDLVPAFEIRQWVYDGLPACELAAGFDEIFASAYSVSAFTTWRDPGLFDQLWVKHLGAWPAPASWHGARLASRPRHPVPGMPVTYTTEQGGVPGPWHARLPHFRAEFTPSAGQELQTEYLLNRSDAVAAIRALAPLAPRMAPLVLTSEIRTVAADDLWLSPAYGRDTVGLHFTWRQDPGVTGLLPAMEEALAPLDPRPHFGKLFSPSMRFSYPRLGDFGRLAGQYDRFGKFRNAFLDGVLGR